MYLGKKLNKANANMNFVFTVRFYYVEWNAICWTIGICLFWILGHVLTQSGMFNVFKLCISLYVYFSSANC